MSNRQSEIFDSFIKIAQEKGMISNDSNEAKKKLEQTQRADSLSITDIEALYGVKPNAPKEMEYEHNIMENAHPNSVVVSPSYDKLNGLVENNNERQSIMINIINQTPNGNPTPKKYAEKEFVSALVSLANYLDNSDSEQLRVLADACLMQVYSSKKPLKKQAVGPLAIAGLVALPIGALWIQQHMNAVNEGYEKNHLRLMSELDDFVNASTTWGTIGVSYKQNLLDMVNGFKQRLSGLYDLYKKIEPLVNELERPKDAEELVRISQQPKTNEVIKALHDFHSATYSMLSYVEGIQRNFKSESFKARQTQDKGFLNSLVDKVQFLHGGKGLIADDFDDVNNAIPPYLESINEILNIFKGAQSIVDKAKAELSQAKATDAKLFGGNAEETKTETKPETKSPLHADLGDLSSYLDKFKQ